VLRTFHNVVHQVNETKSPFLYTTLASLAEQTITGISSQVVIPPDTRRIAAQYFAFECFLSYVEAQSCQMSHKKFIDSILHTVLGINQCKST
jgi:hypothetical protein